uniref:Anti-apoptopic protein n=1 Tax=Lemniscomys rat herpesvirus TaxID=3141920 RepID=A0AAU7E196_9VIRU
MLGLGIDQGSYEERVREYRWLFSFRNDFPGLTRYVSERAGSSLSVAWPKSYVIRLGDLPTLGYFGSKYASVCLEGEWRSVADGERVGGSRTGRDLVLFRLRKVCLLRREDGALRPSAG